MSTVKAEGDGTKAVSDDAISKSMVGRSRFPAMDELSLWGFQMKAQ